MVQSIAGRPGKGEVELAPLDGRGKNARDDDRFMNYTFTPGQLARRAEMYYQLGQMTGAGLGVVAALEQIHRAPPSRSYREPVRKILALLGDGCTLSDAMQRTGGWMPPLDEALLRAGEQSGRLDMCFRLLGEYYRERAQMARQVLSDLAYPLFLLHFAVLIFPFSQFFITGNWLLYLLQTLGVLIPIYALVIAGMFALQGRHAEGWRQWIERALHPIPWLGAARRELALARLSGALEALLSAGVGIIQAWELAATAAGSPGIRQTVYAWRHLVDNGVTPAEALRASGFFPSMFSSQYASGEMSGKLDETLGRLRAYYQEEGSRKLRLFCRAAPKLLYLLVAGIIGIKIIAFYANYFNQIGQVMNGF
jgi:protein transport protein HofC